MKHKVGFPTTIVKSATDISITIDTIPSLQYLPCLQRNMKAYIALLTVPNTITCHEEAPVLTKQPVRKRYDEEEEPQALDIEYEDEPLEIEYEVGGKDRDLIVNNQNHFQVMFMIKYLIFVQCIGIWKKKHHCHKKT